MSSCRSTSRRSRSRSTSRRRSSTASSPVTCGARRPRSWPAIEVGDIFRDGKAYDVQVWSTPETREQRDEHRGAADQRAGRRDRASGRDRRRQDRHRLRTASATRACSGASTSGRTSSGRDLGSVDRGRRGRAGRDRIPAGVPPGAARRVPGAPGRPGAAARIRSRGSDRRLPPAAGSRSAACGSRRSRS